MLNISTCYIIETAVVLFLLFLLVSKNETQICIYVIVTIRIQLTFFGINKNIGRKLFKKLFIPFDRGSQDVLSK